MGNDKPSFEKVLQAGAQEPGPSSIEECWKVINELSAIIDKTLGMLSTTGEHATRGAILTSGIEDALRIIDTNPKEAKAILELTHKNAAVIIETPTLDLEKLQW